MPFKPLPPSREKIREGSFRSENKGVFFSFIFLFQQGFLGAKRTKNSNPLQKGNAEKREVLGQ